MSDLAIAYGVKKRNKYAKGGMAEDMEQSKSEGFHDDLIRPMESGHERGNTAAIIDDEQGYDEKEESPKMIMAAKGGMMPSKKIVHMIMMKKMAKGGEVMNQGDNMPVNEDTDNFSAETSSEGPLDEGMYEEDREDKIMGRKKMLGSIMAKLHSDNKGY